MNKYEKLVKYVVKRSMEIKKTMKQVIMEKESIKHSNKLLQKQEENTYNLCYWLVEVSGQ